MTKNDELIGAALKMLRDLTTAQSLVLAEVEGGPQPFGRFTFENLGNQIKEQLVAIGERAEERHKAAEKKVIDDDHKADAQALRAEEREEREAEAGREL